MYKSDKPISELASSFRSDSLSARRRQFTETHWLRYPAFQARFTWRGQITALTADGLVLSGGDEPHSWSGLRHLRWAQEGLRGGATVPVAVADVIAVGDWLGIEPETGDVIVYAFSSKPNESLEAREPGFADTAIAWATFLVRVRRFFTARGFIEVTTPTLAPSPGTEPFLDPLQVLTHFDGEARPLYLITSPEFHLKKALAAGLPRVFEIARCFRDREAGEHHRTEFCMLEWYRSFATHREIADDVEALLKSLGDSTSPPPRLRRTTMPELFAHYLEFTLRPDASAEEFRALAKTHGVRFQLDDTFDDLFHRLFLEKIEPRLAEFGEGQPVLIGDYPPSQAALARIGTSGFADRFEIYWRGLEIANAFHELNDPAENSARFAADNRAKIASGRAAVPLDTELLECFQTGVPPAGGIALGLERLFMALNGWERIDKTRPFLSPPVF